ncbi:MAG: universal stress protein [Pseudomonadota bacterium]
MFKNILIPVDMVHLEKVSEMVVAAKRVSTAGSKVVLANVVHSVPAIAELSVPAEFFERANEEAMKSLKRLAAEHDIEASFEMRTGQPANEILEIQKDLGIDLIIIGSHQPGLQDYFLGSTASRVVRHAQCPVLVMR